MVATASVPLDFLPVIPGISSSIAVSATATGGQQASDSVGNGGLEPFLPDAHDPTNANGNFGFTPGGEYTLKWGNGSSTCTNDVSWPDPNNSANHGFVDIGQDTNANSSLANVITYGGYPNPNSTPSTIYARTTTVAGTDLNLIPGNRATRITTAMNNRVALDTDPTSTTYAQYVAGGRGNGERVVVMPIGDPTTETGSGGNTIEQVIGFGLFFLKTNYDFTSGSACAYYIGPASMNGGTAGGTDSSKIYTNVLYK